uniref:Uncharacterized protein K02A2.6-like n=1 Tax=Diabrotica virgifera virgifera TaxID=50390 RepID=A0A6P7GF93_DIAVI
MDKKDLTTRVARWALMLEEYEYEIEHRKDDFTKFVWLYPTKSTTTKEVISCLEKQRRIFGNPSRMITDRGTAFRSEEFERYCQEENIQHVLITTGVPRGNGPVERVNRTIIAVLTKLSLEEPTKGYKNVDRVQSALNSTYQRSIGTTPFEVLVGVKMKNKEDIRIRELKIPWVDNESDESESDSE